MNATIVQTEQSLGNRGEAGSHRPDYVLRDTFGILTPVLIHYAKPTVYSPVMMSNPCPRGDQELIG